MAKGYTNVTPERHARVVMARALRARGLSQAEGAQVMGCSRATFTDLLTDPWREKAQRRRSRYGGSCRVCGEPTDGSAGVAKPPPDLCGTCAPAELSKRRHWTKEVVLEAVHRYAAEYGRQPISTEWLGSAGHPRPLWAPPTSVVIREWGSWSACMRAAGFESRVGIKIRKGGSRMYQVMIEQSEGVWKELGMFEGNRKQAVQQALESNPPENGAAPKLLLVHSQSWAPQTVRPVQKVVYEFEAAGS